MGGAPILGGLPFWGGLPYLQCLGDARLAGLVDLRLPDAAAARLAQVAQAEAQVLLVGVLLDLGAVISGGALISGGGVN